jgi:hypothetical protein
MKTSIEAYILAWCDATFEHLSDEYIECIDSWTLFDGVDINFFGKEYSGKDGITVAVYDENDKLYEHDLYGKTIVRDIPQIYHGA